MCHLGSVSLENSDQCSIINSLPKVFKKNVWRHFKGTNSLDEEIFKSMCISVVSPGNEMYSMITIVSNMYCVFESC